MAEVMMTLGTVSDGFKFSLDTAAYQELSRSNSWNWEEQNQAGTYPNLQYTGKASERITLRGKVFPHFRGGLGQVAAMRALGDKAKPMLLTDGLGKVWGEYIIDSLDEGTRLFWANGAPREQSFTLSLKKYAE